MFTHLWVRSRLFYFCSVKCSTEGNPLNPQRNHHGPCWLQEKRQLPLPLPVQRCSCLLKGKQPTHLRDLSQMSYQTWRINAGAELQIKINQVFYTPTDSRLCSTNLSAFITTLLPLVCICGIQIMNPPFTQDSPGPQDRQSSFRAKSFGFEVLWEQPNLLV